MSSVEAAAIALATSYADGSDRAAAGIEATVEGLQAGGVTGPALGDLLSARDQFVVAASLLRQAAKRVYADVMSATEECPTCKGAGTLTEWERDENDTPHPITTDCDDCGGNGSTIDPTPDVLAQQAADRAAYIAKRNEEHFTKGHHDALCGRTCRLNLI